MVIIFTGFKICDPHKMNESNALLITKVVLKYHES